MYFFFRPVFPCCNILFCKIYFSTNMNLHGWMNIRFVWYVGLIFVNHKLLQKSVGHWPWWAVRRITNDLTERNVEFIIDDTTDDATCRGRFKIFFAILVLFFFGGGLAPIASLCIRGLGKLKLVFVGQVPLENQKLTTSWLSQGYARYFNKDIYVALAVHSLIHRR